MHVKLYTHFCMYEKISAIIPLRAVDVIAQNVVALVTLRPRFVHSCTTEHKICYSLLMLMCAKYNTVILSRVLYGRETRSLTFEVRRT